jgi:hypothetical protein
MNKLLYFTSYVPGFAVRNRLFGSKEENTLDIDFVVVLIDEEEIYLPTSTMISEYRQ